MSPSGAPLLRVMSSLCGLTDTHLTLTLSWTASERSTVALQSHHVIWWWFIQKRSEDKFTHLRSQLSSFSPHWLYKTMARHLEKQNKSDKSGPLFCLQYFPTTAVNKHYQGTNNTTKKAKKQARESPAILHCREKQENSNFEARSLSGTISDEKI